MKVRGPDTKTFGVVSKYLNEASRTVEQGQHRRTREQQEFEADARPRAEREQRVIEILKFKRLCNTLADAKRDQFRQAHAPNPSS